MARADRFANDYGNDAGPLSHHEAMLHIQLKRRLDLVAVPYHPQGMHRDAFHCDSSASSSDEDEATEEEPLPEANSAMKAAVFAAATGRGTLRGRSTATTFPGPLGASGGGGRRRAVSIPRRKGAKKDGGGGDGGTSGGRNRKKALKGGFRADIQREEDTKRVETLMKELEGLRDEPIHTPLGEAGKGVTLKDITTSHPIDRPVCALPPRLGARAFVENQVIRASLAQASQVNTAASAGGRIRSTMATGRGGGSSVRKFGR